MIREIKTEFRDRIIVHEHHTLVEEMNLGGYHIKSTGKAPEHKHDKHVSRSFHAFEEVKSYSQDLNYGFLSPIFDSLSKRGYSARFTMESLESFLADSLAFPVYALGGIAPSNIATTKAMGFQGAAVMGSLWQQNSMEERLDRYRVMQDQL